MTKTFLVSILTIVSVLFCIRYLTENVSGYTGYNTETTKCKHADNLLITESIRLVFAGDVMGHDMQLAGAWRDGGDSCYNFIPNFQWVKDYISSADLAIANLEVTFAGEPYSGYPAFSSPVALAVALQDAGFDVLVTANNHILDRGVSGLESTLNILDRLGFSHTGSFEDAYQRNTSYPLMIERNGFRLAFLNYTYGTNMSTAKPPTIVNYLDTTKIAEDLIRAQSLEADFIIACVHWGDEYQHKENATQQQIADFLARHGCNLIVGSHPHVVQPIKKITGYVSTPDADYFVPPIKKAADYSTDSVHIVNSLGNFISTDSILVAYSLGNFISNQRWRYSDGGIMLEVTLTKTDGRVTLDSYRYEPFWVHRYPEKGVQVYRLIPVLDYLTNPERYPIISIDDEKLLIQFYKDTKEIAGGK